MGFWAEGLSSSLVAEPRYHAMWATPQGHSEGSSEEVKEQERSKTETNIRVISHPCILFIRSKSLRLAHIHRALILRSWVMGTYLKAAYLLDICIFSSIMEQSELFSYFFSI